MLPAKRSDQIPAVVKKVSIVEVQRVLSILRFKYTAASSI